MIVCGTLSGVRWGLLSRMGAIQNTLGLHSTLGAIWSALENTEYPDVLHIAPKNYHDSPQMYSG